MADRTLGKTGKALVTVLYLFIYGATLCAYMAEGAKFVSMGLAGICVWLVSDVSNVSCSNVTT
eukprot:scaffold156356_cov42-Prasinocladus_malaysianus.AAC.1